MIAIADIAFSPLLPWVVLAPLFVLAALIVALGFARRARGTGWRLLVMAALALLLANPALIQEEREPIDDVAVVVVDRSPSQSTGDRTERTDEAVEALRAALARYDDLEVRIVQTGAEGGEEIEQTSLFGAMSTAIADIPRRRLAGTFLLTDGQVHDAPDQVETLSDGGPVHVLLTGERDEADRRLVVAQAPSFGLVGRPVTVTLRIDDLPEAAGTGPVTVTATQDAGTPTVHRLAIGQEQDLTFTLTHGGSTVIEFEVEAAEQELSLANNRAALVINGVRDRLRVLLVSGEPHPGERTWRNILKSDPGVDLVHFTILRPPEKQDGTPINELSLISFPIRELFEVRLQEFDLIIFDRYRRRGVLPSLYLDNIAKYVLDGGAFLEASGPQFASSLSLYRTPLGLVLPGEPSGAVVEQGFQPTVTDLGQRHPVTAGLHPPEASGAAPGWGRWFRQIDVQANRGAVVMDGVGDQPLLILDRVGEGRVAQLMSDHIWLWGRGFEGGGPQAELLRRLAHWLMKEPALEEDDLRSQVFGTRIEVERRSLTDAAGTIEITSPSGRVDTLTLNRQAPGRDTAQYLAEEPGIFRISDGDRTTLAVVGTLNPPELTDMRTTEDRLAGVVDASGGGFVWLADEGMPQIRQVRPGRDTAGNGWMGLRSNGDFVVTGIRDAPLVPAGLALLLAVGGLMAAWRREGR